MRQRGWLQGGKWGADEMFAADSEDEFDATTYSAHTPQPSRGKAFTPASNFGTWGMAATAKHALGTITASPPKDTTAAERERARLELLQ